MLILVLAVNSRFKRILAHYPNNYPPTTNKAFIQGFLRK